MEGTCPVQQAREHLKWISGLRPKNAYRLEWISDCLDRIADGRAEAADLENILASAAELSASAGDAAAAAVGDFLHATITKHTEIFLSHIHSKNCMVQVCGRLKPAPCQVACPAGIDVPAYVTHVGHGNYAEAIRVIRRTNPFPWVCGLVCTRPCETECVRGCIDKPVSIKTLKAVAAEAVMAAGTYDNPEPEPARKHKVCIIGAGPAGLTAAYYLALEGYKVKVIEAQAMAGGMLYVGIPRYRLPIEVIQKEVAAIESLGVQFQFNTRFSWHVHMDQLRKEGYDAFLFTIGAHKCSPMGIRGENDFAEVFTAVSFLREVARGEGQKPGNRVVIIGGGNVAIDSARTCVRLGCDEVHLVYRRSREEMPADPEEIEQAAEEGVKLNFLQIPTEIFGKDHSVRAMQFIKARLIDVEGSQRKRPQPIDGTEYTMEVDAVISAVGQRIDRPVMDGLNDLQWTRWNTILTSDVTMGTSLEGIFAAGDAVSGPATVVEAIAGGKKAASAIHRYLSKLVPHQQLPVPPRDDRVALIETSADEKMTLTRPSMPLLDDNRRRMLFQQVELGYGDEVARQEARRCLRCDICIRCGKCVEVCRDEMGINALAFGYMDAERPGSTDFRLTRDKCILCGACAVNCPNDAMRIEDQGGERLLILCGTVLNRRKLFPCPSCKKPVGVKPYLDHVNGKLAAEGRVVPAQHLCDECARLNKATQFVGTVMPV